VPAASAHQKLQYPMRGPYQVLSQLALARVRPTLDDKVVGSSNRARLNPIQGTSATSPTAPAVAAHRSRRPSGAGSVSRARPPTPRGISSTSSVRAIEARAPASATVARLRHDGRRT